MSAFVHELTEPVLLDAARAGRSGPYGELVRRTHKAAVRAATAHYSGFTDPEDLVAEVFVHLWNILRDGGGPRHRLRPYLRVLMRDLAIRRLLVVCVQGEISLDRAAAHLDRCAPCRAAVGELVDGDHELATASSFSGGEPRSCRSV